MKIIKTIIGVALPLLCLSCSNTKQENQNTETESQVTVENDSTAVIEEDYAESEKDAAYDAVLALPEVKEFEKTATRQNSVALILDQTPTPDSNYYVIKVGNSNVDQFVTIYTFYVTPQTNEVRYYDVISDTVISLDEWRAQRSKDGIE